MYFLNLSSLVQNESTVNPVSRLYVSLLDNSRCFSDQCPWGISFKCCCKIIKVDTLFFNLHGILAEYNLYVLFFILDNESCKRYFIALGAVMCWVPCRALQLQLWIFTRFLELLTLTVEYRCQGHVSVWAVLWPVFLRKNMSVYSKLKNDYCFCFL